MENKPAKKFNLKFAISLSGGIDEWISALKIVDVSFFELIELPGECMDSRAKRSSLDAIGKDIFKIFNPKKSNFKVISITDIAPPSIAGEMPEQGSKIIEDFIENIRIALYDMDKLGINSCSLNIGFENLFANEEKRDKTVQLLKRITPFLFDKKINLSLPVRVPAGSDINPEYFPAFTREIMSPWVKLAINIHPHEIKNQKTPEEMLKPFRFQMHSVHFIYEPEAGNFLVPKLMTPWFELLEKYQFSGQVIFVPRTSNISIFSRETERITSILKKFIADKLTDKETTA